MYVGRFSVQTRSVVLRRTVSLGRRDGRGDLNLHVWGLVVLRLIGRRGNV